MNKKTLYILIAIIALLIIAFFVFDRSSEPDAKLLVKDEKKTQEAYKQEISKFNLNDFSGNEVSSNDFQGKLLVLNAWASWCPFCVDELPDFVKLQEAFPDEIAVIAINRAEPVRTANDFVQSLGLSDDIIFLVDPSDSFYKSVGGFSMPETIFITKDGDIALHKRGPFKFPEMKAIVEGVLTEGESL